MTYNVFGGTLRLNQSIIPVWYNRDAVDVSDG